MSAYIKYNNFVFPDPQPFVSVDEEMVEHGGKWSIEKNISLEGKITGDSDTVLYQKRYDLITGLSQSFKEFLVLENTSGYSPSTAGTITDPHNYTVGHNWPGESQLVGWVGADVVVSGGFTRVDTIGFDDSRYAGDGGVLEYSVSLSCINPVDFSSGYYITDPTDEVEYSENEDDGVVEVSHSVSAKGVNTSSSTSDAMNNAKAFVQGRTGMANFPGPTFITGEEDILHPNHNRMVLKSQSESIDRIGSSYSIDETWQYYPSGAATNSIQKYAFTYSSGAEDDYLSAEAKLTIEGGLTSTMSNLRSAIPSLSDIKAQTTGGIGYKDLSVLPNSYSISEDANAKTIEISVSFDNNTADYSSSLGSSGPVTFFDYEVSIDEDIQRNQSSITIQGDLKMRKNQLYSWKQMKEYFDTTISEPYLYTLASTHYVDILSGRFTLNPKSKSYSVTEKSGEPSISINVTFSDEDFVAGYPEADYDITCTPSVRQYKPAPSALHNGQYLVSYLGYYNREKIGFNLNLMRRREDSDSGFPATDYERAEYMGGRSLITSLRLLTTGKGFVTEPDFNMPDEALRFNAIEFPRPGPGFDNYGVRLEAENMTTEEMTSPKISYAYEFSKPANAGTGSVQISLP